MAQYTAHHTGKRIDAARDCATMAITLPAWKESLSPPSRTVFARNIGLDDRALPEAYFDPQSFALDAEQRAVPNAKMHRH